ncbi:MAG: hypothetical protein ACREAS_03535, partial [Nitrososphaera sp.]
FVSLKVTETNPKFVGKGMALIDPNVVEELQFTTGDVIEISTSSGKKNTFALLWSGQPEDYGMRIIRIDGSTHNNLGIGIDDHVKVRKVQNIKKAEQVACIGRTMEIADSRANTKTNTPVVVILWLHPYERSWLSPQP